MNNYPKNNIVKEAIKLCGGQIVVANLYGISQQSVSKWTKKGCIPLKRILLIEKISGISRYKLNPIMRLFEKQTKSK